MVLSSCLNILWVLNILVDRNISVVLDIFTIIAYLSVWTVGDQLDNSKKNNSPRSDQKASATLIVPSPFIELTKNVYTQPEQRVPSKKYVGCRISGEGCVWANFVSLSLTLRPKAGGGVCAEKLMSQKTLLVTTLHLASDTISLDCNSASRKLFIPPTTNYQLKWCFSASYNLSLKINFAWILQVCLQHAELNAPAPSHPRAKIKAVRRMSLVRSLFITTASIYFSLGIKNAVSRYFSVPKCRCDIRYHLTPSSVPMGSSTR